MRKLSTICAVITVAVALTAPSAFSDVQTINFRCIMQFCHDRFLALAGMTIYDPETADWTTEGGLGILDVNEFELLSLILANPSAPNHDAIHAAFAQNATAARTACGSTIVALTTSSATSGPTQRQPIPGTSPQAYYGIDGLFGAYLAMGEWVWYDINMCGFRDSAFGSRVQWPENYHVLPGDYWEARPGLQDYLRANYDFTQSDYLSTCGDADSDTVANCNEYWAAVPNSYINAIDPIQTGSAIIWSAWACLDENNTGYTFAYNPDTERVYVVARTEITWAEALAFSLTYSDGQSLPAALCTIRDEAENAFIRSLADGETIWIGCTDAGNDSGSSVPNPGDWYWLSDPEAPMTYTNWRPGEPNGINGTEDCGTMRYDGTWVDIAASDTRKYGAIFEVAGTFPDDDENGAPDAFEDQDLDGVPDLLIPTEYANTPRPVWSWGSEQGTGLFRYRFDTGDWLAEDVTATSFTPDSDLPDGAYTLIVQERDAESNWVDIGFHQIIIDTVAPDAPAVTGPALTDDPQPTWSWSTGGGAGRYRYGWDEANWTAEDVTVDAYTPPVLPDGAHMLYVQERDLAYNWSASGSFMITVDTTPPEPPVISTDGGNGPGNDFSSDAFEITLEGTASIDTVAIEVNGSSDNVTLNLSNHTWSFTAALAYGENCFSVAAYDEIGHVSEVTTIEIWRLPTEVVYVAPAGDDDNGTGTLDYPWQTIAHAIETVAPYCSADRPVTIQLAEGVYLERVLFAPYVHVIGANPADPSLSTISPPQAALLGGNDFAVDAADGTLLRDLTVELPGDAPNGSTVIRLNDLPATIENVIIDGRGVPTSIGISALDTGSSDSLVTGSLFRRLDYGILAIETSMNITNNRFVDIHADAVFIYEPRTKADSGTTLLLGDVARIGETGGNRFENVSGYFIRNLSPELTLAQLCNWGLATETEIGAKMEGNILFVPFLNYSAESGSIVVSILDADTQVPVENATVALTPSVVPPVTDNTAGIYVVNSVPAAAYTMAVTAPNYLDAEQPVVAPAGDLVSVAVYLVAGSEGECEGEEGEGECEGEGEDVAEGEDEDEGGGCFNNSTDRMARTIDMPALGIAAVLLVLTKRNSLPL